MTSTEKLLRDLIALPSVNPAFLPPHDPSAGEERVAGFLAALAVRSGLEVEFQPALPHRANLLARLSPAGRVRHRIVLAPHLDTVGGAEVPGELFSPRRVRGRLFGRGACDTKGSVAAMLSALQTVAASGRRPQATEILFVGLVDEECGQAGSRAWVAAGGKADLAVVGEPTRSRVVTAHKGVLWLRLETRGKAAHGARPELGVNAVHAMARVVDALETEYAARLRQRRHPLLGHATVNVGSIEGGRQPNIVPAHCFISLDRRTLPGETHPAVLREIREVLRRRGLRVEITSLQGGFCLPLETSAKLPLVEQFLRIAGQRALVGVDYFSDAGVLAEGGTSSVVCGPGDIAQAHLPEEWIEVSQLDRAKDLLVRFLRSLP